MQNPATVGAYAKASHLKGNKGANKLFRTGKSSVDAYGTSTKKYANDATKAILELAPLIEKDSKSSTLSNRNISPTDVLNKLQTPQINVTSPELNRENEKQLGASNDNIINKVTVAMRKEARYNDSHQTTPQPVNISNSAGGENTQSNPNRFRHPFPTRDVELIGRIPVRNRAYGVDFS